MERQSASSSSSPDAGQERVMAAAKHIVKSLAVSKNAADDMMHFLSTFDPRLHPLSSPETCDEAEALGSGDQEEEEEIAAAEEVIRRCNSTYSSSEMIGMTDYLYAVDDAIAAAGHSARAAAAVHAAMPRLEEEVRSLLSSSLRRLSLSSDEVDEATPSASPRHGTLSPDVKASVRGVAGRMLRAGYGPELAEVYVSVRRDALAESVALLGVEAVSIEEVIKMDWNVLDQKMRRWSHAVRGVVRTFLTSEHRLCDEVFESDEELGHECFADVARGCVLQLLGFADAVAVSARAIEKLYRTLGMYEALTDVQPELEALFSGDDARGFFACEVSSTVEQLASAVRYTIEEFGHAIHGDASRRPVHGGGIHPMTRYVLNYGGLLADCRGTLDAVLGDDGLGDGTEASTDSGSASTPSARCIRELLTLLLRKMDEKSRLYEDAGLQNIFLMNNLYYVVQKVRESAPLRELLGDDWMRRHRGQIRQYETGYLRASWMAVLSTHLKRDDGTAARQPAAHRAPQGASAKGFNAAFQELYRAQTAWKVPDPQLREELRIAVSERLIPAYRAFLGQGSRHPARHVKCSLEDLENYMLDFFEGVQKFVRW
ncbi:Exocyst complex component EXO70A1 [Dichanthelium oligosanthes]|uniref:Exocyst subunit Exo70 family protein n=1 Tax=Dichanthelium oligosanthes TaxID=888268 RepID=A0A1E5VSG3_9POAL|nr:Exocyst complex component EXO70A1 [Dichanthelium oligosanthes]